MTSSNTPDTEGAFSYSGARNLELMRESVKYNRFLLNLIRSILRPGDKVLDFGAGDGMFAEIVSARGHAVSCVELDVAARDRLARMGLTAAATLDELPPAGVDAAYTINVLEHLPDDNGALRGLRRALKAHGKLLIYVPAFEMLFSAMDRRVGHLRRYRLSPLRRCVEAAGFRVVRAEYCDSLGVLATLIYKMISDDSGSINRKALIGYDRMVFPLSRMLDAACNRFLGKNVFIIAEAE